jgi:GH25 family lysozyme M1 (1,4-beta-N-acetylmuramidase)
MPNKSLLTAVAVATLASYASAQRSRGIDVSSWQGTVNWTQVRNSGVDFAFVRATRGGTTGTYNQSDPNNTLGGNTLSQSFTDTRFTQNMSGARNAGILAGAYHFSRPDILSYVMNGQTVTHTGLDEANHMLNVAGNYMSMGFLRPVYDLEAGGAQRSTSGLTNFAIEFINRIVEVKGVTPIVYINSNYANREVDSRMRNYDLWMARYIDPTQVNVQTVVDLPAASGLPNVYGVWSTWTSANPVHPTPRPWDFWQYTASGTTPGVSGANDLNVANGDLEFVKDFLVPALWRATGSGLWTSSANWNGSTFQALPGPNDRVTLTRASSVQVTLDQGSHTVRSIESSQALRVTGGSLAVQQYARFAAPLTVSGGTLTAPSITFTTGTLTQTGGTVNVAGILNDSSSPHTLQISGGTLNAGAIRDVGVSLGGNARVNLTSTTNASRITELSIAPRSAASLDVAGWLVLDYTGASPIQTLRSSLAWLVPDTSGRLVGYADAAVALGGSFPRSFQGLTLDSTSIVLRSALRGDADLDGVVGFDDLLALAQNYGQMTSRVWSDGDFDYDGAVGFSDLLWMAQNYNTSLLIAGAGSLGQPSFQTDWALARSLVPEPTVLSVLAGAVVVMGRRVR